MKIKSKYIGSKVFHPILRQFVKIEKGKEEIYLNMGLDIFSKPRKPKLQKNDQVEKESIDNVRDDSDGTDNDRKS